ncbi:MAG: hypothetical protein WCC08_12395, partial [Terrimicrobiaceae bacterium]
ISSAAVFLAQPREFDISTDIPLKCRLGTLAAVQVSPEPEAERPEILFEDGKLLAEARLRTAGQTMQGG